MTDDLREFKEELGRTRRAIGAADMAISCLGGTANEFTTATGFPFSWNGLLNLLAGEVVQHQTIAAAEAQLRDAQQALADLNRALGESKFDVTLARVKSVPEVALALTGDKEGIGDLVVRLAAGDAAANAHATRMEVERVRAELARRAQVLEQLIAAEGPAGSG